MMRHYVAAILVLAVAGSTWAGPAGPTTQPAKPAEVKKPDSPAPAGQALKVTVVSVSGPAQKMTPGAAAPQWEPLKADDKLDEMTIVRTGLNATVVLRFEDRGQFTINSATKIGISEFRKEGSVVKGEVGLKYGSVHASVDSSRGATSFQVSTPVATLSVPAAIHSARTNRFMLAPSAATLYISTTEGFSRAVRALFHISAGAARPRRLKLKLAELMQ